ncbi:MAG: 3'-5' exonuclease, partial [Pseudomonadota bacterium]
ALLDRLRERDLAEQAANPRYLPDPALEETDLQSLVNACINLALANAALMEVFREAGVSDFTTLVLNARASLGSALAPSELALALDYRIRHLLVDEFQDTSVSQYRLFEELLRGWAPGDGTSFFAVGDPMQSIYRFRDADVSLFYRAWTRGIGDLPLEPVVIRSNFRATPALVNWTNGAFQRVMGTSQDPVLGRIAYSEAEAARDGGQTESVRLALYETPEDQVEGIVRTVETLLAESEGTISLLVRSRGQLTALLKQLRRRGISWHANDIDPLVNRPVVRDLLSLISALTEPWQRLGWFALLRAPMFGLTLSDLTVLAEIDDFPALLDALRAGTATLTGLSPRGRGPLERFAAAWPDRTALHELPPRSVIETLWLRIGGADAYEDPDALTHAVRTLELVDELATKGFSVSDLEQAATGLFAADLRESRLEILTIHKAKGLEFDHVLLPFLERTTQSDEADLLLWRSLPEGLLMGLKDLAGPFEWLARENRFRERHERQRLFYVACTRARESLTLFATAVGAAATNTTAGGASFAAGADKPPDTAMLAQLWPFLDEGLPMSIDRVGQLRVPEQTDLFEANPSTAPTAEPENVGDLVRLEAGYRPPEFATPLLPTRLAKTYTEETDRIEQHVEVVLGLVVHAALERLALDTLPEGAEQIEVYLNAEEPRWIAQAESQLPEPAAVATVAATTRAQLAGVLADPDGRRLLAARDQAAAELPLTVAGDPAPENLIIDRTFLEDGVRCIVDYKTSIPPEGLPEADFLRREARRHRPQLERYGDALEALHGDRPRLALYFTALQPW